MSLKIVLIFFISFSIPGCGTPSEYLQTPALQVPIATPPPGESRFIDFHIQGVRLGDSESQVLEKLGRPKSRRILKVDNCGVEQILRINYRGLEVEMAHDLKNRWFVLEMNVTSENVRVEPEVRIGASPEKVLAAFGDPISDSTDADIRTLNFLTKNNDNAWFVFKSDKLDKIRFFVNPC